MCPEFELLDRQVANDVSPFEAVDPNASAGRYIFDPRRAVKKFRRSAAGNYELAEDLRPPQVLLATTFYLMGSVLNEHWPASLSFASVYGFIRDRLRAVRTDLTLQSCRDSVAVQCHELAVRFMIAAGHLLAEEERAAFEPQQNCEQLNGSLSALREIYKSTQQRHSPNEPEMQSYAILLGMDKREAASAIASIPEHVLASPHVQVALDVCRAFQQGNYVRFFKILRQDPRLSYLQACLMHQFVMPVRQRALAALAQLGSGSEVAALLPFEWFYRQLCFVDTAELEYYADRFGFKFNDSIVDLSSIRERGDAVDLRAEEQNFHFRRFDEIIEGLRRAGRSLSGIVFGCDQGMDRPSNYDAVLQCLRVPKWIAPNSDLNPAASAAIQTKIPAAAIPSSTIIAPVQPSNTVSAQAVPNTIDHQVALKKKLEAQATERQRRRERISLVANELLDALIDHTVRFNVSEWCARALDQVFHEDRARHHRSRVEAASLVLNDLLNEIVKEQVTDLADLMVMRVRACEAISTKTDQSSLLPFVILNALEREVCDESVKEAYLECRAIQFVKLRLLRRMRVLTRHRPIAAWKRLIHSNANANTQMSMDGVLPTSPPQPIHIVFVINGNEPSALEASKSLLSPLAATSTANELAYLQTFLPTGAPIQMISSFKDGPVILTRLVVTSGTVDLFSWPANYPGPTHLFILGTGISLHNIDQFPWQVSVYSDLSRFDQFSNGRFKHPNEVVESLFGSLNFSQLPAVEFDLLPSQLVPPEIFQMFINFFPDTHTAEHIVRLFQACCSILWESSVAQRILFWHPQAAGRSAVLETLSRAPHLPSYFGKLMQNGDIEKALRTLDDVIGPCLVACRELLFTNQSLSTLKTAMELEE